MGLDDLREFGRCDIAFIRVARQTDRHGDRRAVLDTRIGDRKLFVRVAGTGSRGEIKGCLVAKFAVQVFGCFCRQCCAGDHGVGVFQVTEVDRDRFCRTIDIDPKEIFKVDGRG